MGDPQPKRTLYDRYYRTYPQEFSLEQQTISMMEDYISKAESTMSLNDLNYRNYLQQFSLEQIIEISIANAEAARNQSLVFEAQLEPLEKAQFVPQCHAPEVQVEEFEEFEAPEVEDLGDGSNSEAETDETKDEGPEGEVLGRVTGRVEGEKTAQDSLGQALGRVSGRVTQPVPSLGPPLGRVDPLGHSLGRVNPVPAETYDFFSDGFSLRYLFDPMPDEESIQTRGVVEDVRVRRFDFLAEFVIVEMEKDVKQSLILGHPFLATSGDFFDMESGDLPVRVHKEELKISVLGAKRRKLKDGGEKSFHFYPP